MGFPTRSKMFSATLRESGVVEHAFRSRSGILKFEPNDGVNACGPWLLMDRARAAQAVVGTQIGSLHRSRS